MKLKVYIIGMPGTGKTHFGRMLAQSMKMNFYDLDEMVEKHESANIRNLIQENGESYFRNIENQMLRKTLNLNNSVIACGGGTPLHFNNMELMKSSGIVIWLNTDLAIIGRRIAQNITRRPMFIDLNEHELRLKLLELFEKRKKIYAKAHLSIEHNAQGDVSLGAVIQRIMKNSRMFRK